MLTYVKADINALDADIFEESFGYMQPERQKRVSEIKNIEQKKCTLAGEWLVRNTLSEITGMAPNEFVIYADEKGKLHSQNTPELFFNISHSRNTVVIAVSDVEVGIDVEKIRPVSIKLAKRVCAQKELLYVFGHIPTDEDYTANPKPDVLERFFDIWTIKEAYFKCIGTGITDFMSVDALGGDFNKKKIAEDDNIIHIVTL